NGSLIVESLPGQSTPDAQPNLAPGQNLSGLTKEEFDALPVGFQAEMIGTGYIFEKDADGKWVIVEGNAVGSSSSNNLMWGSAKAGGFAVPDQKVDNGPSATLDTPAAQTYDEIIDLPVGSVVYDAKHPTEFYTKVELDKWFWTDTTGVQHNLPFNASDLENAAGTGNLLWHHSSP